MLFIFLSVRLNHKFMQVGRKNNEKNMKLHISVA
jgi:hypothetical protein